MTPTPQAPIASPFGYRSTALEVIDGIDLTGKVALVTGGYSGLGIETVRARASAGARVFVAARRPDAAATDLADVAGDV
ncbi:MAG: SDR family NAD(P)-dependent oxidoreductase, partial [Sphingomonas sp.]